MQRDTTAWIVILLQTLIGIVGLTVIAYQNVVLGRMLAHIAELIVRTHP